MAAVWPSNLSGHRFPLENNRVKQQTRAKPTGRYPQILITLPLPGFNQKKLFLFEELEKKDK